MCPMNEDPESEFNVLLVEDSPHIAARMRELLLQEGVNVVATVDDEATAVRMARDPQLKLRLLVLDLQLRQGTGFGVLSALGEQRPPTVVITNYDLPQYRQRMNALGVKHFLNKAVDFARLPEIIADLRRQRVGAEAAASH